jgi:hypothetical protein
MTNVVARSFVAIEGLAERSSYVFLCLVPLVATALIAPRALRIPIVYQIVGGSMFVAIAAATWTLAIRGRSTDEANRLAVAGALLLAPFEILTVLWVGLGPPWEATAPENVMRYAVLAVVTVAISGGFVVTRDALAGAGERIRSALGVAAGLLAGGAYLVWLTFELAAWLGHVRVGHAPDALVALSDAIDIQLFIACALTYLATALVAASMGRVGWLGRAATRAYVIANGVALALLVVRGLSFPNPTTLETPWYTQPGFVVGIPAMPWIMPGWLGAVVLKRAGRVRRNGGSASDARQAIP